MAQAVEFPGEERIDLSACDHTFVRQLDPPFGSGRIEFENTTVDFERVIVGDAVRDHMLLAWTAAAMVLALLGGGSYRLVRMYGDGEKPQWGRPPSLSEHEAANVRVRIGPDGLGASRPQAGRGVALHGKSDGKRRAPEAAARPKKPVAARTPKRVGTGRVPILAPTGITPTPEVVVAVETPPEESPVKARSEVIDDAQAALLAADLRKAIDSFSRAARAAPLDYDQLNWLGLAHYLTGEYADAEQVWTQARALDPSRPDAVNNLASVAKRRGDTAKELEYLNAALALQPADCHASNSLALAQAKSKSSESLATLARSDGNCGGNYAYTAIQKAGILAMNADPDGAFKELESGLARVDTLIPIKEFEVLTDLKLDPAFSSLRSDARFAQLVGKYLPRAAGWKL